jgi:hypothetical protein
VLERLAVVKMKLSAASCRYRTSMLTVAFYDEGKGIVVRRQNDFWLNILRHGECVLGFMNLLS